MSWLFGSGNPPQLPPGAMGPPPPGDGNAGKGGEKTRSDAYSFDSAALERAAKAAQTLERSGNFVECDCYESIVKDLSCYIVQTV